MPLPRAVARFNRVATNRITEPLAAHLPAFAVLVHRGRVSGSEYRTPVNCWVDDRAAVVALTYGRDTDWLKNLRAAGGGVVLSRGWEHRVGSPVLIGPVVPDAIPGPIRLILNLLDVHEFVEFPVLSRARPT